MLDLRHMVARLGLFSWMHPRKDEVLGRENGSAGQKRGTALQKKKEGEQGKKGEGQTQFMQKWSAEGWRPSTQNFAFVFPLPPQASVKLAQVIQINVDTQNWPEFELA